jgi:hypothetical protein
MSLFTTKRMISARPLATRLLMVLLAIATVAMTASTAHAADPVIRQVLGIDHDAVINGKVNITARVGGKPDQVVFALSGPLSRTAVRTTAPYFFLSNKQGNPRYWNTANAPQGAYTMSVRAIKNGRVTDSLTVNFTIDKNATRQDSLSRKQRARTPLANDTTVVNSSTTTGNDGSGTVDKRSTQPVLSFPSSAPDTHERGSNESIRINISGDMPANSDILAIAWDHDRKQIVSAFAHSLNTSNPRITADKLDLLPDGRLQIQLLYRENSVVQYKKLHDLTVVTPAGSVDIGVDEPDPVIDPTKIVNITGIDNNSVVNGPVTVKVNTDGDTPDQVVFNINGPAELTDIQTQSPYVFLSDLGTWDTTKYPNGAYNLTVTTLINGNQTDTQTLRFTVNNEVTLPDPVVAFPANTPATYRLGEGIDISYNVDRDLPENATVLVLAWSSATWGMVSEFAHFSDQGPWTISADKLALLQPGRSQLQLLYRVDNKTIYKRTQDIEVLPAYGDEPVVDNGANTGGNAGDGTGGNSTVDDNTTNTGSDTPPTDPPLVDSTDTGGNSGGTGGTGGTGGGSTTGNDTGASSGGSSAGSDTGGISGGDPGNTPPPDTVVNADQSAVLGMNLSFVTYWTREWVFTNVMRQSKGWISTNTGGSPWDNGNNIDTDVNGWPILKPGQAAATYMLNANDGRYPAGKYICTYEGEGDIVFNWDAKVTSTQNGRIEVNVTPSNTGIYLRIENSNPNNHIRNIRLVHEDLVDRTSSFHPLFVERLKPFKTLRFMDWQRTNTTSQRQWSDRVTPDYATQAERGGVAIELLIELANELGADPWVCMPAQADDDYIRNFAQLVKDRLHPGAKVYVEWSNEIWNTQFEVHKWVKQETDNQSMSMPFFDKWAAEARRDFAIWTDVWGADSDRVVRVAATQAALSWGTGKLLDRLNGQFDAIAPSTYFGLRSSEERAMTSSTSAADIIAILEENIVTDNRRYYAEHGALARQWSQTLGRPIRLIAYEGGQHLADGGQNKPHKNALIAAQDHPKMYDLYQQNMLEFERAGGSANVMFNYVGRRDQWGSWGHLQYQDEPTSNSLKFKAMLDYPSSQKRLELTTFD